MVLWTQILDSSVAEFILSGAEGLIRNDKSRFEIVTYRVEFSGSDGNLRILWQANLAASPK